MSLIVQKFGGTSVADTERLRNVARIITETYKAGNQVVAVLSAQGDTTDDLIQKAEEINPKASAREMDMLLSTGEQISVSLCAMAIEALGYPVISAGEWAHRGSFEMLAGDDLEKQQFFSLENHVDQEIPPVFLWHTAEDPTVPVENSLFFVKQLSKYKIPFEYHVYPFGKHGLSLATDEVAEPDKERFADPHVAGWIKLCGSGWMR